MSDSTAAESTSGSETMSAERLARFEAEVAGLSAGAPGNPERTGSIIGIIAGVAGAAIAIVAYAQAQSADRNEFIYRYQILAGIGLAVALSGALVWLRNSLVRYLRWWLVRHIYEQRDQTDRIVEALRDR